MAARRKQPKKYEQPTPAQFNGMRTQINRRIVAPMALKFLQSNFKAGGRPKFVPNAPSTLARKRRLGQGSKPLIATGLLKKKAIDDPTIKISNKNIILAVRSPTKRIKVSMNILHWGGWAGRNHSVFIPARPWTTLTPSQIGRIQSRVDKAWGAVAQHYSDTGRMPRSLATVTRR